jgi:hypothetical protein
MTETLTGQTTRPVTFALHDGDAHTPRLVRTYPAGTVVEATFYPNDTRCVVRIPGSLWMQTVGTATVAPL